MSVTTKHADYEAAEETWRCLRDAYAGSGNIKTAPPATSATRPGVKLAGERYLPRPSGMRRAEQYAAYVGRASWRPATEVVVHGMTGAIFRREPQQSLPTAMEPQARNITRTGVPLRTFAENSVRETLLMGRLGILIDFPQALTHPDGRVLPPPATSRPYWIPYLTEEITNWHIREQEGTEQVDLIVLREWIPIRQGPWPSDDYFIVKSVERRRVLRLNEDGVYEVSLWQEVPESVPSGHQQFDMMQLWIPERLGQPLTQIPFIPLAPFSLDLAVVKSLLEPLVEINYRNYRHSADYEHGLHLTSLPTPWISGKLDPQKELLIGSLAAWVLPEGAHVGMLEYQGQGLQPHEKAIQADIQDMATYGARLLEQTPFIEETATAVMARTAGSESPIQTLIRTVSEGITKALRLHAWWAGMTENLDDPEIDYTLNNDLVSRTMDPTLLQRLMENLLNNTISYETFFWNLQRGEIARPQTTVDEEKALIEFQQQQQPLALSLVPVQPSLRHNGQASGTTVSNR